MNGRGRLARILSAGTLTLGLGLVSIVAQELTPSLPVAPYQKNDRGLLVAQVQFGADGKATFCRIVRSNVPYPLEATTVDYIKRKWVNEVFAGDTVNFPISFDEVPWYAKQWNVGLVPPPNLLSPGDPGRTLKLRVIFDGDGWAQHVEVEKASGIDLVDRMTAIWVKVHWHSDSFAGKTVDAPFQFKAPPALKPVVVKAPAKPKPQPAPAEEVAAPAVRVE